jgi:hypothetical protein
MALHGRLLPVVKVATYLYVLSNECNCDDNRRPDRYGPLDPGMRNGLRLR